MFTSLFSVALCSIQIPPTLHSKVLDVQECVVWLAPQAKLLLKGEGIANQARSLNDLIGV